MQSHSSSDGSVHFHGEAAIEPFEGLLTFQETDVTLVVARHKIRKALTFVRQAAATALEVESKGYSRRCCRFQRCVRRFLALVFDGDIQAAFDSADTRVLARALSERKMPACIIAAIMEECSNLNLEPCFEGLNFGEDHIVFNKCIRQGGNEGPWAWNIIFGMDTLQTTPHVGASRMGHPSRQ